MTMPNEDYITDQMKQAAAGFLNVEPINPAGLYGSKKEKPKTTKKQSTPNKRQKSSATPPKPKDAQASLF